MKNKKTGSLIVILLLILVFAAMSGSAYAYMRTRTMFIENELVPANVACEVFETFENNEKTSITVKNTGNIDAYIRVRLVTYWVKTEDDVEKIVGEASASLDDIPFDSAKWIEDEANNTYYYKNKVSPEEYTAEFLADSEKIVLEADAESGLRQVIEVFAEAIQADPAKAATESWGVTITNGVITAVN